MQEKWADTIINWYSENKRNLPWRNTKNPYYIWLSEIILQQTQVQQGLPYYTNFVTTFPSVFDLAKSSENKVLKLWQGLGYYSRARNLHASAKYIAEELDGKFPATYKELLKLKGVGDYTASAIASICFKEPTAVVDGNVYRVLSRYFGIQTPINTTLGAKEFKQLAQHLIDEKRPDEFNQAIMEFGARQCKPKSPNCSVCVFNDSCYALQKQKVNDLPVKLKKLKVKKKFFNYVVCVSNTGETLLQQRNQGIWQGLYQFPLIETDRAVDKQTFIEKLAVNQLVHCKIERIQCYNESPVVHKLSHQHLYTTFWIVNTECLNNGVAIDTIKTFPVPVLISRFVERFFVNNL